MNSRHLIITLLSVLWCGIGFPLQAEDAFDSLLDKLVDDRYQVRMEAKKELLAMCRKKPKLTERLALIIFDEAEEVERVISAREVVAEAIYVERGAIGIAMDQELIVESMVEGGPAMESGIQIGSQLISLEGKPVKGKTPSEIYRVFHSTRPGEKLEMEFVGKDGDKLVHFPVVAPRSTVRDDENPERRKKDAYEKWLDKQRKRLELDED